MKIFQKSDGPVKEGKFLVVRRDGTVPHWPAFVLGARDPHAEQAIRHYAYSVLESGGDKEYAASLHELADDFRAYRAAHGDGDPWAPPHRHDNTQVIHAMRGEAATITVRPDKGNAPK